VQSDVIMKIFLLVHVRVHTHTQAQLYGIQCLRSKAIINHIYTYKIIYYLFLNVFIN
jgi:hypothetical protein